MRTLVAYLFTLQMFSGYALLSGEVRSRTLQSSVRLLASKKVSPPPGFTPPEPKPLSVVDGNYNGALTGTLSLAARLGTGVFVLGWSPVAEAKGSWPGTLGILRDGSKLVQTFNRPKKTPIIYEYEASPFCRKVREACCLLDLTVEYRPCPGARQGWSDFMAKGTKGVRTVPYLVDDKVTMFESDDIIRYLFNEYGPGEAYIPWTLKGEFAQTTAILATQVRGFAGARLLLNARKDMQSLQPVTLWGYEGSPFVRPVRETLSSLGLAHIMVNCARGSANRDKLYEKTGRFQVPYLEDRNTGISMFESAEMVKYLLATYTEEVEPVGALPNKK